MSKKLVKSIVISLSIIVIVIAIISTFFVIKNLKEQDKIDNIAEIYSDENIQERIDNEFSDVDNLMQQINDEYVIGTINIEKIGFNGLIYKGTSLDTLSKGVGHFENTPYLEGNVCLAAHNSSQYWAKLHTLEIGDKIFYTSFLGSKEYKVIDISQIGENDWSKLSNTEENILTLITCVKGKPTLRLCVQALEVK